VISSSLSFAAAAATLFASVSVGARHAGLHRAASVRDRLAVLHEVGVLAHALHADLCTRLACSLMLCMPISCLMYDLYGEKVPKWGEDNIAYVCRQCLIALTRCTASTCCPRYQAGRRARGAFKFAFAALTITITSSSSKRLLLRRLRRL
jgi:hypothetical protein